MNQTITNINTNININNSINDSNTNLTQDINNLSLNNYNNKSMTDQQSQTSTTLSGSINNLSLNENENSYENEFNKNTNSGHRIKFPNSIANSKSMFINVALIIVCVLMLTDFRVFNIGSGNISNKVN